MNNFTDVITIGSFIAAMLSSVAGLAWFISSQFTNVRSLVYDTRRSLSSQITEMEKDIVNKLEYHEQHDDKRFNAVNNDIWDIRVRNAARDGLPAPKDR